MGETPKLFLLGHATPWGSNNEKAAVTVLFPFSAVENKSIE